MYYYYYYCTTKQHQGGYMKPIGSIDWGKVYIKEGKTSRPNLCIKSLASRARTQETTKRIGNRKA